MVAAVVARIHVIEEVVEAEEEVALALVVVVVAVEKVVVEKVVGSLVIGTALNVGQWSSLPRTSASSVVSQNPVVEVEEVAVGVVGMTPVVVVEEVEEVVGGTTPVVAVDMISVGLEFVSLNFDWDTRTVCIESLTQ